MDRKQQRSEFGEWLERQLRRQGMTRRALADAAGMSEAAIYSYVTPMTKEGFRLPSARSADAIALALGVDPNEAREAAELPPRTTALPRGSYAFIQREGLAPARVVFVPVIGIAPAETARYAAEVGEMMPVPAHRVNGIVAPRAVIVSSEAFASRGIHQGDYLLLETAKPLHPEPDQIVMIVHDDRLTGGEWIEVEGRGFGHLFEASRRPVPLGENGVEATGVAMLGMRVWEI